MIGLPSLAALDGTAAPGIWLAAEATDMRCGFDRLAALVQTVIGRALGAAICSSSAPGVTRA